MKDVRVGSIVTFKGKRGAIVKARITKINRKTLACVCVDSGMRWRVSPTLITLAK
jgi:hypothetical protein